MRRIAALAFLLLLVSGVLAATVFNQVAGASGKSTAKRAAPAPGHVIVDNNPLLVGGTVQLAAGTSVETTATDNPAFQPVTAFNGEAGTASLGLVFFVYTVPAGKRLVIEQVSFDTRFQPGDELAEAFVTGGGQGHFLNVTHTAGNSATGTTLTRIYANPGENVSCGFVRTTFSGNWSSTCTISGHLVDVP
jgi:hypothetical protein